MKTLIAIPCMETLETEFVKCLIRLKPVGDMKIEFLSGSLVYAAREQLCDKAIAGGYDYVLWLDSDMLFEPSLMEDLLACDKDIVSGLYFTRKFPIKPTIFKSIKYGMNGIGNEAEQYMNYPKHETFEIDACGFGAVLMKTKVLEDVVNKYHTAFTPVMGYGEDIAFCIRAKDLGYKVWCNSDIKLGHLTRMISNEDTFLATQNN